MAKSPLAKGSKLVKPARRQSNVIPLVLTIPIRDRQDITIRDFDVTHLTYRHCDINNERIKERISYIRKFATKANEYVANGKSAQSNLACYEYFKAYIFFCDSQNVNPFSREGYLTYFGNDGELRHQCKRYKPSIKLWQRHDGEELGIKESSCNGILSFTVKALVWCGVYDKNWKHLHRSFNTEKKPFKAYSDSDENLIITRLSDLFFGLASQLIALKKDPTLSVEELPVIIEFGAHKEELRFTTSLRSRVGKVNKASAFNIAMGAAYHLFCYFTSLNDGTIREVCHPLIIETNSRDKSLKTVKVKGYKDRASKVVSAILTNEVNNELIFDVEKRSGVTFIETLTELSKLYGSEKQVLYTLNVHENISPSFDISEINKHLVTSLNLVTSHRELNLPWFRQLFYTFVQGEAIALKTVINSMGRRIVSKTTYPLNKPKVTRNILDVSHCILSCFTDNSFKGALLPLTYSQKKDNGNVRVSFYYDNGQQGFFDVPAHQITLIKDIEDWATDRADRALKSYQRYLLRYGNLKDRPKQWDGFSPIKSNVMKRWGIEPNEYFLTLQSSRFRETTSIQEYNEGQLSHLTNLLQSTLATLDKHYANGHPETNKKILSQAIQIIEHIAKGSSLKEAKNELSKDLGIKILTYDEWLQTKTPTNPNGIMCDGKQALKNGKNTQRATNKAVGRELPCSDFDICYQCNSAKAVDEPNSIYKLISFIDVLKEALDHHPEAKQEVQNKISAFEYTLESASSDVLAKAMTLFNQNGRHPRVTKNHALLSVYR